MSQHCYLGDELNAQATSDNMTANKVIILTFDDGRETQFTQAKPILDKYGFKATFYVVCNYVGSEPAFMNWNQLGQLNKEGYDIGSHTMNHPNLSNLSQKDIEFEVGQSKKCLMDHGINSTSFAYPYSKGTDDKQVIEIVSKYYDLARTNDSPLMYLHCDGWKDKSNQTDCRTYAESGNPTFANRYSIRGWGHDFLGSANYTDDHLFNRFVKAVRSQAVYNADGKITAIPIIVYHRVGDNQTKDYNLDLELFEKEIKYLHDNNFRALTMKDLGYQTKGNYLYIK